MQTLLCGISYQMVFKPMKIGYLLDNLLPLTVEQSQPVPEGRVAALFLKIAGSPTDAASVSTTFLKFPPATH